MATEVERVRPVIGAAVILVISAVTVTGSDYTVTRSTTIESQRPIWLLVVEAGMGVIDGGARFNETDLGRSQVLGSKVDGVANIGLAGHGRKAEGTQYPRPHGGRLWSGVQIVSTQLHIDGSPAPGIGGVVSAAWRLVGFIVWNEAGRIERVTDLQFRGHSVRIVDAVSNGRVWVRVTVGPPLGDKRVRYAVLTLNCVEEENGLAGLQTFGRTNIELACSAVIDIPGDRCGLVRRLAQRIAEREAGTELRTRVDDITEAGQRTIRSGRRELIDSVVGEFLERVCR